MRHSKIIKPRNTTLRSFAFAATPHRKVDIRGKPKVIVLSGYGLNCEDETAFAFRTAGAEADIVHVNDLKNLDKYQILCVPGGFSFGDDTGSGKAFARKLGDQLSSFLIRDTLMIGICNGFQILTQAGILPGVLTFNDSARYMSRWVEIEAVGESPWLEGITPSIPLIDKGEGVHAPLNVRGARGVIVLPIANGEGKYIKTGDTTVAFKYVDNPNGSQQDIAGVLGYNGRVLGIMPHPERAQFEFQHPPGQKAIRASGLQIFKNAIRYFK